MECRSEVAQLMRQIDWEYEAAQRGLYGLAEGVARHDFITQKMENIGTMNKAFQRAIAPFLGMVKELHGGQIVDDELLQHREVFLSSLECYLDEPLSR